jgi:Ca-activated chloride channel family protein
VISHSWRRSHCAPVVRTLALALALSLAPDASGQVSPPADTGPMEGEAETVATFQKSVDEVNIFFSALDGHGRAVPGLSGSDFVVTDRRDPMPISFFQSQTDAPLRVTVAIDLSGSVEPWVKYEVQVATKFLASVVRPGDVAEIVGFGPRRFVQRDLPRAGERLLAIVNNNPQMSTAVYDAVRSSCLEMSEAGAGSRHRNVLVLMSDGEDNSSRAKAGEALRAVAESGVIVFVLYTGSSEPGKFLRAVARNSGGRVFGASSSGRAAKALTKLATMLREQYVIAFHPPDLRRDGTFHEVSIRPLRKGVKVYSRRGYYALAESSRAESVLRSSGR